MTTYKPARIIGICKACEGAGEQKYDYTICTNKFVKNADKVDAHSSKYVV